MSRDKSKVLEVEFKKKCIAKDGKRPPILNTEVEQVIKDMQYRKSTGIELEI